MLRSLGIEYLSLVPGASFRGIHDSVVNYGGNVRPELILCTHELVAVSMTRGYARASGRPMGAILHNVVGLLNGSMGIFDLWVDRTPAIILGGSGPVDAATRRPWIDWIHTANVQGTLVRGFTKWDDQPASVAALTESLLRAYRMAVTEPTGPVYVAIDPWLQEDPLVGPFVPPDPTRFRASSSPSPDAGAVTAAADLMVAAERPVCLADRVGRTARGVELLVELAELLALPVIDLGTRWSFPSPHPLDFQGDETELIRGSDVVLALDVVDLEGVLRSGAGSEPASGRTVIHVSMDELSHRGLIADHGGLAAVDVPILAPVEGTLAALLEECRRRTDGPLAARVDARRRELEARQADLRRRRREHVAAGWDGPRISEARLIGELAAAIEGQEFVFTYGRLRAMGPGLCRISGPAQHLGHGGGGAVGTAPGAALGAALALRGSGRLPIAVLGDGALYMAIQSLWTAAHYRIPSLWVVNNNRSYGNDEDHQGRIARARGRPPEDRGIGTRLDDPPLDFAAFARAAGLHGEGPIERAEEIGPAVRRALEHVRRGELAIVDVRTGEP